MTISAADVKALRDTTGAGMMDAKRALTEANGDAEAATQLLREQGLAKADARADRENTQGAVAVAANDTTAAIVLLKCETDFSAKNDAFTQLTQTLADDVLNNGTAAVDNHAAALEDLKLTLKENVEVGTVEIIQAAAGNAVDTYVHRQDGRGVNAVIVEGQDVNSDDLHQVALHVAFAKPEYLSSDDVPDEEADRERAALREITKAEGKPEEALDKIVEGRMRGWYAQRVLLEQGLHGDKTTVAQSVGKGKIVGFKQVLIGA